MTIRGLDQAAKSLGITPEPNVKDGQSVERHSRSSEEIPMMYRAQVEGRCSLMFAGNNKDLERWKDEWVDPSPDKARYQRQEPSLGLDGTIYRIAVNFPFRLLSDCGQDSITRPILGKDGIPYFSGSSVKGLFRRICTPDQVKKYCGDPQELTPSLLGFRFHGAYPVGDWSGMHKVKVTRRGESTTDVRYRMLDVVHPQQERQLGSKKKQNATALASISLYKPRMIFEFSCADPEVNWEEVERIFWRAIALGFGGKTSIGYGLGGNNESRPSLPPFHSNTFVYLMGQGVSSTLRNDEPEFRPNMFKASLRGHVQRLLAGVVGERHRLDREVNRLFGSSDGCGEVQLFWEHRQPVKIETFGATPVDGILHINASKSQDADLIEQTLKFGFIMGGFGKSWRRASHELFHESYSKFEIGCHWQLPGIERSWITLQSLQDLKAFLETLHHTYIDRFGSGQAIPLDWREAWHPDRLSIYAAVTQKSNAITLFHHDIYKYTPAIGGKNARDDRPKFVSSVWHRMLPINEGEFLEIVTMFHAKREQWKHETDGDQLNNFIQSLKDKGLSLVWGNSNLATQKNKKSKRS